MTCVTAPKDLGDASYILGLEIYLPASTFSQMAHTHKTLMRYGMSESLPVATLLDPIRKAEPGTGIADSSEYQTIIGSLMCPIWPSQSHSCHNSSLDRTKDTCAKRVLRYLSSTVDWPLHYPQSLLRWCIVRQFASPTPDASVIGSRIYGRVIGKSTPPTRLQHGLQLFGGIASTSSHPRSRLPSR